MDLISEEYSKKIKQVRENIINESYKRDPYNYMLKIILKYLDYKYCKYCDYYADSDGYTNHTFESYHFTNYINYFKNRPSQLSNCFT